MPRGYYKTKKPPLISPMTVALLSIISLSVIGFFFWQYRLHQSLTQAVVACYGGKYFENSCSAGAGCYSLRPTYRPPTWNPYYIPTNRDAAVSNLSNKNNQEEIEPEVSGYCLPWMDIALKNTKLSPATKIPDSLSDIYK